MVTIKGFISSVISGLEEEREVTEEVLNSLEFLANRFEIWPAHPGKPRDKSLEEVEDSELFILILGDKISDIVIEEYETAKVNIPHRILVFVKDINRTKEAERFFNQIREEYIYKKFNNTEELKQHIKNGIQSLLIDFFKNERDYTPDYFEEPLLDVEGLELKSGESIKYELQLFDGDIINGIIDEEDGDPINIYLVDRNNYVKKKNKDDFDYFGDEYTGAYNFDEREIDNDGPWYLLIENNARRINRVIDIRLSVKRFT